MLSTVTHTHTQILHYFYRKLIRVVFVHPPWFSHQRGASMWKLMLEEGGELI